MCFCDPKLSIQQAIVCNMLTARSHTAARMDADNIVEFHLTGWLTAGSVPAFLPLFIPPVNTEERRLKGDIPARSGY